MFTRFMKKNAHTKYIHTYIHTYIQAGREAGRQTDIHTYIHYINYIHRHDMPCHAMTWHDIHIIDAKGWLSLSEWRERYGERSTCLVVRPCFPYQPVYIPSMLTARLISIFPYPVSSTLNHVEPETVYPYPLSLLVESLFITIESHDDSHVQPD